MPTSTPLAAKPVPRVNTLRLLRQLHLYVGVFIAPMLLFFAFTGAVQTLGLHEAAADYKAPNLLISLGQIHKKQTYLLPAGRKPAAPDRPSSAVPALANAPPATVPQPTTSASRSRQEPTLAKKQREHLPLKVFFVLVSLGLFISTATGIYMAYKFNRNRLFITALLVAGVLTPIILVGF